jgi:hypothetical protein
MATYRADVSPLDDTQTRDAQGAGEGCGGRDPLDVPNVKRAPIFPQWQIPAEWIGARKSDLSTILLKFALRTVSAKERKKESLVDYE